ncbi:hypothetical protein [Phyllobacterium meliloti]|uniref:hypothetical protein n=1 Tax=Phyllobacterium meliloti TaxID=555317 RepID=UPI001D149C5B|nr:hypothetical protein [Phyllobacterium sp. T1293]UGX85190.1 hypothetical protein LLE53_011960 [Phyllobacterium sp. T1293]
MKLLSEEWLAAEQENKALRNVKREEFWSGLAVTRSRDMADIDIAPQERLANIAMLLSKAGDRTDDAEILSIAATALVTLNAIGPGSMDFSSLINPIYITDLIASARKAFFVSDVVPTYDLTKIG